MTDKMGEGIIVSAFADHLARVAIVAKGINAKYVSANFQGKNDKQFADYFASIDSQCVLLEFKEHAKEFIDEKKKPLRNDLCSLLIKPHWREQEKFAANGHFLAWGDINSQIENIHSYPKKVCPLFGVEHEFSGKTYIEEQFVSNFVGGTIGLSIDEMNDYVAFLSQIAAQGDNQPECPEFKAILLSYDDSTSKFIKQPFDDLCELKAIMDMSMDYIQDNKPTGPRM